MRIKIRDRLMESFDRIYELEIAYGVKDAICYFEALKKFSKVAGKKVVITRARISDIMNVNDVVSSIKKMKDEENKMIKNDFELTPFDAKEMNPLALIDIKINEFNKYNHEKNNKLKAVTELISYYEQESNKIKQEIIDYETKLKNEIVAMLDRNEFKETKTQLSHSLVSGKIVIKKESKKIVIKDRLKLLAFLAGNKSNEYIKIKKDVDWIEYKKNLHIDSNNNIVDQYGEIIEDCEIEIIPERTELKL